MSQRCPVCRARLWSDFWSLRLRCPRCDTQFRPTVSWGYFRVLVVIVAALLLVVGFSFAADMFWITLLLGLVVIFFLWSLPRFVDLQQVLPTDLIVAEGPRRQEEMQLRFKYRNWDDEEGPKQRGPGDLTLLLLLLFFILSLLIWIRFVG